jgi:hypothetical protein
MLHTLISLSYSNTISANDTCVKPKIATTDSTKRINCNLKEQNEEHGFYLWAEAVDSKLSK